MLKQLIDKLQCIRDENKVKRVLLGILFPVFLLCMTYSGVFYVKGELLWCVLNSAVMALSGYCMWQVGKTEGDSDEE